VHHLGYRNDVTGGLGAVDSRVVVLNDNTSHHRTILAGDSLAKLSIALRTRQKAWISRWGIQIGCRILDGLQVCRHTSENVLFSEA
jgi:hypothetical protein